MRHDQLLQLVVRRIVVYQSLDPTVTGGFDTLYCCIDNLLRATASPTRPAPTGQVAAVSFT